jgi:ribose 5-phosphate isomerase A
VIIADESKWVEKLGRFPLPVEVIPNGWRQIQKKIIDAGCPKAELRLVNNVPCVTDNGHYIIDCHYTAIENASGLNIALHLLPGLVETGLFIGLANEVIIGHGVGKIELKNKTSL